MHQKVLSSSSRPFRALLGFVLLTGCADTDPPTAPPLGELTGAESYWSPGKGRQPFKVYTQNAYLGGDTGPLFSLDFDFSDPANVVAVLEAVNAFWSDVLASDIPGRAAAIVDEIDERRPHFVGLQEVVRFGVFDLTTGAVVGGADFLANVMGIIAARGLPYEVVAVQDNTSSALPLEIDFATMQISKVLAFTDRLAVLRRSDVTASHVDKGNFQAEYELIPGQLTLKRGWIRVSTRYGGTPFHFLATHLETQGLAPVQAGQADQLIHQVLAGLDGVTVLAGDLNSDAANPGAPSWTPTYDALIGAGFTDAWLKYTGGDEGPGYTCCQDPGLDNHPSSLEERIDFVLVRDARKATGVAPGGMRVEIVGEEDGDLTASGLWPADHAGLFAGLRMPKGLK
jgi:hypothetical protein